MNGSRVCDLDTTRFADLVALGTRAPSLHNTQPWRFRWDRDAVEILADPDPARALPVTDPSGWGVRIALGAAAYNVRLGYALLGWRAEVEPFPGSDVILRVHPEAEHVATPAERELAAAIPRRHTNRRPYLEVAVPADTLRALVDAAGAEACRLTVLDPRAAGEAFALIRAADEDLEQRPGYAAERRAWTRGSAAGARGSDAAARGSAARGSAAPDPVDGVLADRLAGRPHLDERLRRRDFGGGAARPYESDPCLAVLTTSGDSRYDELRAGQALQHVLLRATASGLTASLYSQPIEVASVRTRLSALCGGGTPQMVVRVGYGLAHSPTPRRPVHEVVLRDFRP
ncbi:Acg family FMN-binding oxidoreductase [Cryptosporangium aurantiacum]|uniref:Nitroreductase n=1 Tax=Cryptosporangium aurantiacum TaxID=134849 RepID=A0A1M7TZ26_9ACTN|nr:hypothetical protein [Cryptosporangium aurantiacum]SHN75969.1 Nitroreductase [Cryptosporangium aurantiacum]